MTTILNSDNESILISKTLVDSLKLVSDTYLKYQLLEWATIFGDDVIINFINDYKNDINFNSMIFNSVFTSDIQLERQRDDEKYFIKLSTLTIEGRKCKRCNNTELSYIEIQTRSGDEAFKLTIYCYNCNTHQ